MGDERKREQQGIGPGGMDCACCGPAPGDERKRWKRARKRSMKQEDKKRIREVLAERADEDIFDEDYT